MSSSLRRRPVAWIVLGIFAVVVLLVIVGDPGAYASGLPFGAAVGGDLLPLGTNRFGQAFDAVLASAMLMSGAVALAGTIGVLLGALLLGIGDAHVASNWGRVGIRVATLAAMAMPDVTLLLSIDVALPRETPRVFADVAMMSVLGVLWIPPSSRLVASRVQSLRTSLSYRASVSIGFGPVRLIVCELLPSLTEDLAWLFATIFPRFLAVEIGLAYIGLEYHFQGLGSVLKSSYEGAAGEPFRSQLAIASVMAAVLSVTPVVLLRASGGLSKGGVA